MSFDNIVNVAKGAWEVLKDGQPSADIQASTANAVPDVDDWQALEGARGPMALRWHWRRINGFGIAPVDVDFVLKWDYGARYRGGGAFIPNLWIEVPKCEVLWAYDVDIRLTVRNPTNAGDRTAPHARLPVTISGTSSTMLQTAHVEWGFTVYGNGTWEQG